MDSSLDFQSIIMKLQQFWADQGCLIWQPYYTQVGAGTYNPSTFLRVLGPEPWKVAYVEPSVRPDDGRYGENPNRLVQHTQFQVILKPDPGNPQEIYIRSLQALGIDPREHDIRFVEDNWESPALGAWGLGWEVWLDGQEITQFTYFQQAGGMALNPVSVEITYGLERIAMTLQRVRNFKDLQWSPERTYGDVMLQGEQEHSTYYFDAADVERAKQMYELYRQEAEAALDRNLVLPAHDYILKMSHTFNILDTRGAIGVTERAAFFARMRDLARRTAEAFVAKRQALEFPWLADDKAKAADPVNASVQKVIVDIGTAPADLLFEIGTEELPAGDLTSALEQLKEKVPAMLQDLRLAHEGIRVEGTPRRLAVTVKQLSSHQPDLETVVKGPPAARAFDALGDPTPAGIGFAKSRGLDPKQLTIGEIDGGKYVVATVHEKGRSVLEVLSTALPNLISSLRFDKTMRWNESGVAFSRPIRWLTGLWGGVVVPYSYAGLNSAAETRGLRFHEPEILPFASIEEYANGLRSQGILLDSTERRTAIRAQVEALITAKGGDPSRLDESLLDEVTNLVEAPTALIGSFDVSHLELPAEVLVSVMQKYQRYFPIYQADGTLLPYFVVIRNGDDQHLDVVADGNEQVIRARFADASFFVREDSQLKLEDMLPRLGTLVFQKQLGSMLDKTHRVEKLIEPLMDSLHVDPDDVDTIRRAATLSKADLVSKMVIEMTSLAGIMGKHYALRSGETSEVANAVFESTLPRFAGDKQPSHPAGLIIGLADRLDSLAGLFAAGLAPSGTKDPFAQRRAALGLVQNLITWEVPFDLRIGLAEAARNLPIEASAESQQACFDFIAGRLQNLLLEQGARHDVVSAVLAEQSHNPSRAAYSVRSLAEWMKQPYWDELLAAYARCARITKDVKSTFELNTDALREEADEKLLQAVLRFENERRIPDSVDELLSGLRWMAPIISEFFDKVLVMAESEEVRQSRLALLQRVTALAKGVADFSKLEGF